jgi:hypothetical protein
VPKEKFDEVQRELDKLRDELKTKLFAFHKYLRIVEIHGKTGEISYYDGKKAKSIPIDTKEAAEQLIEDLREQAGRKEVFVYFMTMPRVKGYFGASQRQIDQYREWFAKVPNSLPPKDKTP